MLSRKLLFNITHNNHHSTYRYDDAGNRIVKLSGHGEAVFVCASDSSNGFTQTNRFTAYPNPYMVYNGSKYFKHIYVGSERIVSKVSANNPDYDPRQVDCAGHEITGYNVKLQSQQQALSDSIASIYAKLEVPYFPNNNDDYGYNWADGLRRSVPNPDSYGELAYFYHSDHLGSTSYVTDANGEVSQHVEYVPFGEVFIEELSSSAKLNTPFLFNGKEFDEETGLYYYGARYYDPRLSLWLSVDPLSNYDPLSSENYLDGEHNGGVYNSFNNSVYSYCYNNPVKLYEPNGKQAVAIHGTWSDQNTWQDKSGINTYTTKRFGNSKHDYDFSWSGGNYTKDRTAAALKLISYIRKYRKAHSLTSSEPITLVGHSHGGNVAIETANLMVNMAEFDGIKINLLTINTPVRDDYQLSSSALKRVTHINVYDPKDPIQITGGNASIMMQKLEPSILDAIGEYGSAGRTFKNATNIKVNNPQGFNLFDWIKTGERKFHNSHNRTQDWIDK